MYEYSQRFSSERFFLLERGLSCWCTCPWKCYRKLSGGIA